MVRFEAPPGTEVGLSAAGEPFTVTFTQRGGLSPDIEDPVILAALLGAVEHPDAPIKVHIAQQKRKG